MQKELSEKEKKYIKEMYCDSKEAIQILAEKLSDLDLNVTEEEFLELVISAASRYQSFKFLAVEEYNDKKFKYKKLSKKAAVNKILNEFTSFDDIIQSEINLINSGKYEVFDDYDLYQDAEGYECNDYYDYELEEIKKYKKLSK